ncbi:MAG: hypothetical protein AAFN05_01765 [Pseudomonadota bacterium]
MSWLKVMPLVILSLGAVAVLVSLVLDQRRAARSGEDDTTQPPAKGPHA